MMAIGVLFRNPRVCFTLALALAFPAVSFADDEIIQKSGAKIFGHIDGVSDGQVTITSKASNGSPVTLPYTIADIKSVVMTAPPAFVAAKGQPPAQVAAALAPLVKSYAGLPADWVVDAMAQLADAYSALKQDDQSAAIYAQINTLYPGSAYTNIAVAGQAKLQLAQGHPDQALATIQPIIDAANKTVSPSAADGRVFANAFLVYGQILEAQNKAPQALEAYLTVKTVFYQNQSLVDQSDQLVKNLRAHNAGVSVD
jgi:tetratricopeptide (TPR) repeat protein